MLASANRLLRFEFPVTRNVQVFERLVKNHALSAGLTKKTVATLPLPFLEKIYQTLWQAHFEPPDSALNEALILYLLLEELSEFDMQYMTLQDITTLGIRDIGAMHSYYYQDMLSPENMTPFLTGHGYRTDFLECFNFQNEIPHNAQERNALYMAYWACRRLSMPLPWHSLLNSLTKSELESFSRLARLKEISEWLPLNISSLETSSIAPESFHRMLQQIRIRQKSFGQTGLDQPPSISTNIENIFPRPVRVLVIVEGETENHLLPLLGKAKDLHFNNLGIALLSAGGKNHIPSLYREYSLQLCIPICILLDDDAATISEELTPQLRPQDSLFQIAEGEFEDTYNLELAVRTINEYYQPYPEITASEFQDILNHQTDKRWVQTFRTIWRHHQLGPFDKVLFARQYAKCLEAHLNETQEILILPHTIQQLFQSLVILTQQ